ncbi:hypothetical protein MK851_08355 [Tenacibaculum sp. 1B UA]|uniref:hypothetical protein n=1 Tax=Tenacibaculum sp. 1B UA TaxID=2922252 RepID=UPI002A23AFFD|nr:hypothetical protein [Tenacibaculum sp. 1B UA]MDX8553631.1 hypothetical protein [Tenacibaculum sp. 1B UA]
MKKSYSLQGIGLLYFLLIFIEALFVSGFLNQVTIIFFSVIWIATLCLNIKLGNKNPLASIYSVGVFLYFYQVPLINFVAEKKSPVYNIVIDKNILPEYFFTYILVLGFQVIITYFLSINTEWVNKVLKPIKLKKSTYHKLFMVSILITILLLLYAFKNAGGVKEYFLLNKFESIEYGKLFFFTWKDFAVISFVVYFISEKKNTLFLITLLILIFIELLTAKRFLILFFVVFMYVTRIKKVTLKIAVLILIGLVFANFTKYTYYNLKNVVVSGASIETMFWFEWSDFFRSLLFLEEFLGHIRLTYLFLYNKINIDSFLIFDQLLVSLPFGNKLITDYSTAGEILKNYLREPWAGLASSMYIIPYLSLSFFGLLLIYSVYMGIILIIKFLTKKSVFFKVLFFMNIPIIFFYCQREEIIVVTKNLFITSVILLIMLILFKVITFFKIKIT